MSLPGWLDQERRKQDEALQELNRLAVAFEFAPMQTIAPQQRQEFVLCVQNIETHFGKETAAFVNQRLGSYFSVMRIADGEISAFQKALGECRIKLRHSLRLGKALTLGLLLLTAVAACVTFVVKCMPKDSKSAMYQRYEFAPHIGLQNEKMSYVLPSLITPGPNPAKDIGRKTGRYPRWFSYQAELQNSGTRPVDVQALWMCAGPKAGECTHHIEIRRTFVLEPGGRIPVSYIPLQSELPLFPELVSLRFFLQIEVVGPGNKVELSRPKVGGFEEERPVIVRAGTVVPEGTAAVFEIEFIAPENPGEGTHTGRSQVEYAVQAIR